MSPSARPSWLPRAAASVAAVALFTAGLLALTTRAGASAATLAAGGSETDEPGSRVRLPTSKSAAFELPDLVLTAANAPASVQVGQSLRVSERTGNRGRGRAGASTTAVYLSRNRTKDGKDVLLAKIVVPRLGAGRRSAGSKSALVPETRAGVYYVVFCADDRKKVRESNERNNCASSRQVFVIPRSFRGTVTGMREPIPPNECCTESWTGTVTFEVRPEGGDVYGPASSSGSITYSLTGTSDGCEVNGGGSVPLNPDDGTLRLFVVGGSLRAQGGGGHPFGTSYPATAGPPCNEQYGAKPRSWLRMPPEAGTKFTPDGIVLDGTFVEREEATYFDESTFTWHLVGS